MDVLSIYTWALSAGYTFDTIVALLGFQQSDSCMVHLLLDCNMALRQQNLY